MPFNAEHSGNRVSPGLIAPDNPHPCAALLTVESVVRRAVPVSVCLCVGVNPEFRTEWRVLKPSFYTVHTHTHRVYTGTATGARRLERSMCTACVASRCVGQRVSGVERRTGTRHTGRGTATGLPSVSRLS